MSKRVYISGLTMEQHKTLIYKQAFKKHKTKRAAARALGVTERIIKRWLDRKS